MSVENLINLADRSKEERTEIARKGGIASGDARSERKRLKNELIELLETSDSKSNKTVQEKMCLALINKCLEGNIRAFEIIRDTVDGKPKPTDEISELRNIEIIIGDDLDEKY